MENNFHSKTDSDRQRQTETERQGSRVAWVPLTGSKGTKKLAHNLKTALGCNICIFNEAPPHRGYFAQQSKAWQRENSFSILDKPQDQTGADPTGSLEVAVACSLMP